MTSARRITKRVRLAQKKRKSQLIFFLLFCVAAILAYAGLSLLLVQQGFKIETIVISNNKDVNADLIQITTRKNLASVNSMALFRGTILTYNKKSIKEDLLFTYPRLESVELNIIKLDTIEIVVEERIAVAQWCGESCYLVDRGGFVFEEIKSSRDDLVKFKGNLSRDVLRQTLLKEDFIRVNSLIKSLQNSRIQVEVVDINDREMVIKNKEHPDFKIKIDDNLDRVFSYIEITLDSKGYKEKLATDDGVGYIDLRFGNRIYYK